MGHIPRRERQNATLPPRRLGHPGRAQRQRGAHQRGELRIVPAGMGNAVFGICGGVRGAKNAVQLADDGGAGPCPPPGSTALRLCGPDRFAAKPAAAQQFGHTGGLRFKKPGSACAPISCAKASSVSRWASTAAGCIVQQHPWFRHSSHETRAVKRRPPFPEFFYPAHGPGIFRRLPLAAGGAEFCPHFGVGFVGRGGNILDHFHVVAALKSSGSVRKDWYASSMSASAAALGSNSPGPQSTFWRPPAAGYNR